MMHIRPFEPRDAQAALNLRVVAFSSNMHVDLADSAEDLYTPDDHRLVAVDDGRVIGHLAIWSFAQSFGGRAVPMAGVASVAIAPDQRGRGIGSRLLEAGLDLMAELELPVSTLYPSTPAPYRAWGWEIAGSHVRRTIATRELLDLPRPSDDIALRPFGIDDLDAVLTLHNSITAHEPGGLQASDLWFRRMLTPVPHDPELVIVAVRGDQVVGLLLAGKDPGSGPHDSFGLRILHLFGADGDAEMTLWHAVAGNHSVASTIHFNSQPADPLQFALPRVLPRVAPASHLWMTRLVDAPAAVAARGWPALTARIELHVTDPRRQSNEQAWMLEVDGEDGQLTPASATSAGATTTASTLDIGALSTLYTGFTTPWALARAGRITGCNDDDLATLTALFSGPAPFLRDYF